MKPGASPKYRLGPGGLACVCCTKGHPRTWKHKARRLERRKAKQYLKRENND